MSPPGLHMVESQVITFSQGMPFRVRKLEQPITVQSGSCFFLQWAVNWPTLDRFWRSTCTGLYYNQTIACICVFPQPLGSGLLASLERYVSLADTGFRSSDFKAPSSGERHQAESCRNVQKFTTLPYRPPSKLCRDE